MHAMVRYPYFYSIMSAAACMAHSAAVGAHWPACSCSHLACYAAAYFLCTPQYGSKRSHPGVMQVLDSTSQYRGSSYHHCHYRAVIVHVLRQMQLTFSCNQIISAVVRTAMHLKYEGALILYVRV